MDETLEQLGRRIRNGMTIQFSEHEEQELYFELERNRSQFLQLFDVGARNAEEAKSVEKRMYKLNGKEHDLNATLVRPAMFLAEQLDCSEYFCAALCARVQRRNPNLDAAQLVEKAVEVFHGERTALLYCLKEILEGSSNPKLAAEPLGVVLRKFTREITGTMLNLGGGRRGRLPELLLQEIDHSIDSNAKLSQSILDATSITNPLGGQGIPRLSHDVLQMRINCLRGERRLLGYLLFVISALHHLSGTEILKLVERLAQKPNDDMVHYVLASALSALDFPGSTGSDPNLSHPPLFKDLTFVASLSKVVDNKASWKSSRLRAVLALKWSLFIWGARHQDAELTEASSLPPGFSDEEIEKRVWDAVQSDLFSFLSDMTQLVRPRGAIEDADRSLTGLGLKIHADGDVEPDVVDEDFKIFILREYEALITTFIVSMSPIIRRIKHRQEDISLAASRSTRPGTGGKHTSSDDPQSLAPRNDIAELFEFIGLLYMCLPPDEGLKFWVASTESGEGKLFAFIRWATESRERTLISAAYDMLSGISKGRVSAEITYNFLSSGQSLDRGHGGMLSGGGNAFSWTRLFTALSWWADTLPNPRAGHHHHQQQHEQNFSGRWRQSGLSDAEALMIGAFLGLLRMVVKRAPAARIALYSMPDFRIVPTLFALLQHSIQLEIKGVIFDVLAAFCEPGAGVPGIDICKNIWTALERAELINLRPGGGIATRGVENELEGVETPAQRYPATIPFLRLLNTLIHTPKDLPSQEVLVEGEPLETIPNGLGQPSRLGGIIPYIRFIVDTVLLRARNREYIDSSDKWRMVEGCLGFIERCLASYNLRYLLTLGDDAVTKNVDILRALQIHPGFDLLCQLLTDSPLRTELVEYITQGVDALESKSIKNAYFEKVVLRVLRIVHRILEIQELFIELLLPLLAQLDGSTGNSSFLSSAIVPFDQLLNWSPHVIVKIALCTLHTETEETKLLAIKIISLLSESTVFTAMDQAAQNPKQRLNRLAVILGRGEDSKIISDGFMVLLQRDTLEETSSSPEIVEMSTGAGAPSAPCPFDLGHAIRLAILQLFLRNTSEDKTAPNVAHMLLGFDPNSSHEKELALQDPHAAHSHKTCLHVILDLLNSGVPRSAGDGSPGFPTLLISHPVLAEQCYRLVNQLCSHRTTSLVTMRYLRTREDFFARHLSVLPFRAPHNVQMVTSQVIYGDNSRVSTNAVALTSFLRIRAWVLQLAALELHVLTEMGQAQRASRLLMLLFGNAADNYDMGDSLHGLLQPFAPGQSLIRIIELFQSFDFEWFDGLTVDQDMRLQLFTALDVSACLRVDDMGCEIVDADALLSSMRQNRLQMQSRGVISSHQVHEQLRNETRYILTSCAIENNRRQIQHAKGVGFESWKRLLDVCLIKGFHQLPQDRRESILFDLLQVLPPTLQDKSTQQSTAVLLSEAMLSLVTKLRDDRQQQLILQSNFDDTYSATLPTERLKLLLKSILDCLVGSGRTELIRGNLYASLINYIHLINAARESQILNVGRSERGGSESLFGTQSLQDEPATVFGDGSYSLLEGHRPHEKRSDLDAGTLAVFNKHVDGLVSVISIDAIDGTEVWKAVSFMLLDSLVALSRLEKPHRVLGILSMKGYLHNIIQSIKDSDSDLQQVLQPDPDNLNALYVYEAKLALLIRIAQTRMGSDKLLECRLFRILAQCDFIDSRPEADQSFIDHDSFLPSAVYRYHQLVLPALELVNSVVSTPRTSAKTSEQALSFLLAHRETFLILLRESMTAPSLAQIREMQLLISICSYVVPHIDRLELGKPASGFGGIHAAILSLAAKCLFKGRCQLSVSPVNEAERQQANVRASGYGSNLTVFDTRLEEALDLLLEAICVYLEVTSDSQVEDRFTPVLTPVSVLSQQDEPSSQIIAPAPTISDSIDSLTRAVSELGRVLGEVTEISAKLSNKDSLGLEEVEEIARSSGVDYTEDLDMMQRRLLAYKVLEMARQTKVNKVFRWLHSLEVLLLVIWRHIHHYSTSPDVRAPRTKGDDTSWRRSSPHSKPYEISTLLEHVTRILRPLLERLEGVQLPPDIVGPQHRSREGFIEMMRRLIMKELSEKQGAGSAESAADDVVGLGSW